MSFSQLKSRRGVKEKRSYIYAATRNSTLDGIDNVPSSASEPPSKSLEVAIPIGPPVGDTYHKPEPPKLYLKHEKDTGRGMHARVKIKAGTVVLSVKPHVAVISTDHLETHCSYCLEPVEPPFALQRCSTCKVLYYCNSRCQKKDWPVHSKECPKLAAWKEKVPQNIPRHSVPGAGTRTIGRMVWKRKIEGFDSVWTTELDSMQNYKRAWEDPVESKSRLGTNESHQEISMYLAKMSEIFLNFSSESEREMLGMNPWGKFLDLISSFRTNAFTLTDETLTPIGTVISPSVALFNHSCVPNCAVVFPKESDKRTGEPPNMMVVTLKDIAADEQLFTSYIDSTLPRAERKKALADGYYFNCACALCAVQVDVELRDEILCPKDCGGRCRLPKQDSDYMRCSKCKSVIASTPAVSDAVRVGKEALKRAEEIRFEDPAKALHMTQTMIPLLQSAGLTQTSHPLLALNYLHQSLLLQAPGPASPSSIVSVTEMNQAQLDELIRTASRSVFGFGKLLCEGHPVRAIALVELGKLLAVDEPEWVPDFVSRAGDTATRMIAPSTATSSLIDLEGSVVMSSSVPQDSASGTYPPHGPARLQLAHDTLMLAHKELKICYGSANGGGKIGRGVREIVLKLKQELDVWRRVNGSMS